MWRPRPRELPETSAPAHSAAASKIGRKARIARQYASKAVDAGVRGLRPWSETCQDSIDEARTELPVERPAAQEQAVEDWTDQEFVDKPDVGVLAKITAPNPALDDRRQLLAARLDDPLAVLPSELGLRGDLGDESLHGRSIRPRRPYLDDRADKGDELLTGIADVDWIGEAWEHVDHDGVQGELPLIPPAAIDRRLRNA